MIETENLSKHFTSGSGLLSRFIAPEVVHAVDNVTLTVEKGRTVGLVGESGCGKSTLGRTLLRLHKPTSGTIHFKGTDISTLSQRELLPLRREMQMVFQDPHSSLNPKQTVGEILRRPIEFHDLAEGEEAMERAISLLKQVGMEPEHINRYPHEFSGGQQQRISIARALSVDPEFIVLDEPTSALDVSVQSKILSLIEGLQETFDLTLVLISHDLNVIRHICDEVAVMYLGELVEQANADELFDNPYHPYTKALLNSIPLPDPHVKVDREQALRGNIPSPLDPPEGCRFHTRCPEVMDECKENVPELRARSREGKHTERQVKCHLYD